MHAKSRGAEWWKSFTTGKSAEHLGGVPHDAYGMTSLSIRQYVLGVYKQLGLREKDITKVQTGGPGEWNKSTNDIVLIFFSSVQMEIWVQVSNFHPLSCVKVSLMI